MLAPKDPSKLESEPGKEPVFPRDLIPTIVSIPRRWSLDTGRSRHAHLSCDKYKCLEREGKKKKKNKNGRQKPTRCIL